jgi:predicted aspartyl protease
MPVFEVNFGAKPSGSGRPLVSPSQVLRLLGPVLTVVISPTSQHLQWLQANEKPIPDPISGLALIDTGAAITAVDEQACNTLGLHATGVVPIAHAGGSSSHPCYPVHISFPGTPLPSLQNPRVASVKLSVGKQPIILLLGRDLLSKMRVVYNGPAGRIELAF